MGLVDRLSDKGMQVREIPEWGGYLREQWEQHFADHLSAEEKEAIYLHDGYLWHLFSYAKKDCLKEERADWAFDKQEKKACYIFYERLDLPYCWKMRRSWRQVICCSRRICMWWTWSFNGHTSERTKPAGAVLTFAGDRLHEFT